MARTKALFFDLDETLLRDVDSERAAIDAVLPGLLERLPMLESEGVRAAYRRINNRHWSEFDESPIASVSDPGETRAIIWKEVLREFNVENNDGIAELGIEFERVRQEHYARYDDVDEAFERLRSRYPLFLVTNGNSLMQREKLRRTGLENSFKKVFIAQEVGVSKPKAKIFQLALNAAEAKPDECIMVGDNLDKDIVGALTLGIPAVWMRRNDNLIPRDGIIPTAVVNNLIELNKWLDAYDG